MAHYNAKIIRLLFILVSFSIFLSCEKAKERNEVQKNLTQELTEKANEEKTLVQIDDLAPARLLDYPDNGNLIIRIPTKEKLEVIDSKRIKRGMTDVLWYKVKYKNYVGWISQYVTTGELIREKRH